MKLFLIFICALFTFGAAYADEYTVLCPAGYRANGDFCDACPAGTYSNGGYDAECIPCPSGTYSTNDGTYACTACPGGYENTEPGAASMNECYSDVKLREYDGTVECRTMPDGCTTATCTVCESEPEPCEYVAYPEKVKKGTLYVYQDGEIKSGCAANPCLSDILDVAYDDTIGLVYNSETDKCEACGFGTYYNHTKDKKTGEITLECHPCADTEINEARCMGVICDAGYYLNGTTCTKCPDEYPNSDTGTTTISQCYSGTKLRPWTGEQTETLPSGCADATFGECQIDACEYVEYYGGTIKSGCETNNENCGKPILTATANPGYIFNGTTCETCPAGMYYNMDSDTPKCEPCPKNTYSGTAGATECTPCPASHPNSNGGTNWCYTDELERPWTGHQVCNPTTDCMEPVCSQPCEIKPCKYIETYVKKGLGVTRKVISGCETNNANCSTPIDGTVPGWGMTGPQRCEQCPAGTYSVGGENAECVPCPQNKSASMPGATSADECGRILNYRAPNATTATQIFLGTIKNTSPALAIGIGNDIFYANMTPVNRPMSGKMHIGYNDKTYMIASNDSKYKMLYNTFYITTTADTDSFEFKIIAAGNFTVDWGDGDVETVNYGTCAQNTLSHTYYSRNVHIITLNGNPTEYCKIKKGLTTLYRTIQFSDTTKITGIDGSLGAVFPTLDDGTNPNFKGLFSGAVNLTGTIPDNLFRGITGSPADSVSSSMFNSVFSGCSGLTGRIPVGLFGDLSGDVGSATFTNAFYGCSGLSGPAARNPDGTPLYDIEYNGQTWLEYAPGAFTDMYTGSGISDL